MLFCKGNLFKKMLHGFQVLILFAMCFISLLLFAICYSSLLLLHGLSLFAISQSHSFLSEAFLSRSAESDQTIGAFKMELKIERLMLLLYISFHMSEKVFWNSYSEQTIETEV